MPNFYFLVRFLAHHDNIVRNRIADLFLEHKINDDAIPAMIIHAIRSFGISENLPSLRLLPFQDLSPKQIGFFLSQREKLILKKTAPMVLEPYDTVLKKLLMSRNYNTLKPFVEELPPEFLKAIYLKKWRQTIHRDLFKVYSAYPPQQILPQIQEFISKHKRRTLKRSYLAEIRIWSEVFYVNFTKVKNQEQKEIFFKNTENYFENLTKPPLVQATRKKVYPLETCYHLLSAGWWSMDHLLKKIMEIFTLDCDPLVYEEVLSCLLEFEPDEILNAGYELLVSHKVTDKAFPYFLKLFFLPGELEENSFYAKSEERLLAALQHEKHYARRIQICLALSDLFSEEFLGQGSALIKKTHFNFTAGYGKYRSLLQERLLVHSLLTGKNVEGLENFTNSYIEKKPSLTGRFNTSFFFKKKNENQ